MLSLQGYPTTIKYLSFLVHSISSLFHAYAFGKLSKVVGEASMPIVIPGGASVLLGELCRFFVSDHTVVVRCPQLPFGSVIIVFR